MRPRREPARNNQQTYMVTSETWGRRALFRNERWAKLFVDTLLHYRGSAYLLHEFVVMPDHFHALTTPSGALERAVQFMKGGFSHRAKKELMSNLEVWQKGFSDHRIRDAADYAIHVRYIHENPVQKHLCQSPEEYPYSSAHQEFVLDDLPQRLKPLSMAAATGAAEAAPLQRSEPARGMAEAAPLQNDYENIRAKDVDDFPQRLKPLSMAAATGAAEAAPLQRSEPARGMAEAASLQRHESASGVAEESIEDSRKCV